MTTCEPPLVSLPQYEGPLDLLLDLVRTHRLNILDLPIAEVTSQYLGYLRRVREFNIDVGADFILMAATLIHIKSRTLLRPGHDDGEPDPRQELVEQLLTREQAQQAAALLAERLRAAGDMWAPTLSGAAEPEPQPAPATATHGRPGTMNLREVLRVAKTALATAKAHRLLNLKREPVTVEGMMHWLSQKLNQLEPGQFLTSTELFTGQATAGDRAALFLAILEMARAEDIHLQQEEFLAPFRVSAAPQLPS
ncbi:MAG TPA: ScpA family protein [Terriglobia bacterium]|nr:ScpA family protein [Terriglobia bacterium]